MKKTILPLIIPLVALMSAPTGAHTVAHAVCVPAKQDPAPPAPSLSACPKAPGQLGIPTSWTPASCEPSSIEGAVCLRATSNTLSDTIYVFQQEVVKRPGKPDIVICARKEPFTLPTLGVLDCVVPPSITRSF
jgi:hypothetical protein